MEWTQSLAGLPDVLKVLLPLLLILFIGALVKRVFKFVVIIGLVILFILFVYPLFDY